MHPTLQGVLEDIECNVIPTLQGLLEDIECNAMAELQGCKLPHSRTNAKKGMCVYIYIYRVYIYILYATLESSFHSSLSFLGWLQGNNSPVSESLVI